MGSELVRNTVFILNVLFAAPVGESINGETVTFGESWLKKIIIEIRQLTCSQILAALFFFFFFFLELQGLSWTLWDTISSRKSGRRLEEENRFSFLMPWRGGGLGVCVGGSGTAHLTCRSAYRF